MSQTKSHARHKIAIQISTEDEGVRELALINAKLFQESYGADNVHIVIVAFGPGLGVLTKDSPQAEQIAALASNNIEVNACAVTMKMMGDPPLVTGVVIVPNGPVRMIELQEHGYSLFLP
jgi:uncharacterized protein